MRGSTGTDGEEGEKDASIGVAGREVVMDTIDEIWRRLRRLKEAWFFFDGEYQKTDY